MNRLIIAVCIGLLATGVAKGQEGGCRFLSDCTQGEDPIPRQRTDPRRTATEHLERCLADYVRRWGPFVPEGHSTRSRKSKSDMTAMCKFAIERSNFYWDYPRNTDEVANMKCCMEVQRDEKACRESLWLTKESKGDLDYCYLLSKAGEPPPPDWNVPADCKGGPCMVTPGYCRSVGYTKMDANSTRIVVATMRSSIAKAKGDKETQEQLRAVLRVCFGVN